MRGLMSVAFSCDASQADRLVRAGVMQAVKELREGTEEGAEEAKEEAKEEATEEGAKEGAPTRQTMAELLQAEVRTEQNNHEEDVMSNGYWIGEIVGAYLSPRYDGHGEVGWGYAQKMAVRARVMAVLASPTHGPGVLQVQWTV
jgi:hypothetical protein